MYFSSTQLADQDQQTRDEMKKEKRRYTLSTSVHLKILHGQLLNYTLTCTRFNMWAQPFPDHLVSLSAWKSTFAYSYSSEKGTAELRNKQIIQCTCSRCKKLSTVAICTLYMLYAVDICTCIVCILYVTWKYCTHECKHNHQLGMCGYCGLISEIDTKACIDSVWIHCRCNVHECTMGFKSFVSQSDHEGFKTNCVGWKKWKRRLRRRQLSQGRKSPWLPST